MKAFLLIIACNLMNFSGLQSQQEQLVLLNKNNNKERIIAPGKKITVFTLQSTRIRGPLSILTTSVISVGSDTLPLSAITKIRAKMSGTNAAGGLLIVAGSLITMEGIMLLADADNLDNQGTEGELAGLSLWLVALPITIGGGILTTTGIIFLSSGKKYSDEKWDFSIRKGIPSPP